MVVGFCCCYQVLHCKPSHLCHCDALSTQRTYHNVGVVHCCPQKIVVPKVQFDVCLCEPKFNIGVAVVVVVVVVALILVLWAATMLLGNREVRQDGYLLRSNGVSDAARISSDSRFLELLCLLSCSLAKNHSMRNWSIRLERWTFISSSS